MKRLFAFAGAAVLAAALPAAAQQVPTGLHGIKIAVADYEKTTQFYTILGMTAGTSYNPHERELRWADPAKGSVVIMVKDDSGRMARGGNSLMISVTDVPATVARLKAAGFAVPGEPNVTPRATIMMLKDPDGNAIELLGGPFGGTGDTHRH